MGRDLPPIAARGEAGQAPLFLVLASWLLGSAKFACLQRQKPAMFEQMPLFVYRHVNGSVCTTSSDGRFMGMFAFTEFPPNRSATSRIFSSRYNAVRIAAYTRWMTRTLHCCFFSATRPPLVTR
jgi:hypothetical protein